MQPTVNSDETSSDSVPGGSQRQQSSAVSANPTIISHAGQNSETLSQTGDRPEKTEYKFTPLYTDESDDTELMKRVKNLEENQGKKLVRIFEDGWDLGNENQADETDTDAMESRNVDSSDNDAISEPVQKRKKAKSRKSAKRKQISSSSSSASGEEKVNDGIQRGTKRAQKRKAQSATAGISDRTRDLEPACPSKNSNPNASKRYDKLVKLVREVDQAMADFCEKFEDVVWSNEKVQGATLDLMNGKPVFSRAFIKEGILQFRNMMGSSCIPIVVEGTRFYDLNDNERFTYVGKSNMSLRRPEQILAFGTHFNTAAGTTLSEFNSIPLKRSNAFFQTKEEKYIIGQAVQFAMRFTGASFEDIKSEFSALTPGYAKGFGPACAFISQVVRVFLRPASFIQQPLANLFIRVQSLNDLIEPDEGLLPLNIKDSKLAKDDTLYECIAEYLIEQRPDAEFAQLLSEILRTKNDLGGKYNQEKIKFYNYMVGKGYTMSKMVLDRRLETLRLSPPERQEKINKSATKVHLQKGELKAYLNVIKACAENNQKFELKNLVSAFDDSNTMYAVSDSVKTQLVRTPQTILMWHYAYSVVGALYLVSIGLDPSKVCNLNTLRRRNYDGLVEDLHKGKFRLPDLTIGAGNQEVPLIPQMRGLRPQFSDDSSEEDLDEGKFEDEAGDEADTE